MNTIKRSIKENKLHFLKLKREFWAPVFTGAKTFEVRNNDRKFKVGDLVMFRDPENDEVMEAQFIIGYILSGWGIADDHVVFSMFKIEQHDPEVEMPNIIIKQDD